MFTSKKNRGLKTFIKFVLLALAIYCTGVALTIIVETASVSMENNRKVTQSVTEF